MLKKTITYTDFNDNVRTEDFYFNLSRAEMAEWELRENLSGGLGAILAKIVRSNDGQQIMDAFRQIIIKSYGIKSDDGRSFIKSEEISAGFLGSEAYSVLFMELLSDPDSAATFINAIVPKDLVEEAARQGGNQRPQPQDHHPKQVASPQETRDSYISRPPHESASNFAQQDRPKYQGPGTRPHQEGEEYNPFNV